MRLMSAGVRVRAGRLSSRCADGLRRARRWRLPWRPPVPVAAPVPIVAPVARCWCDGGCSSLPGRLRLADIGRRPRSRAPVRDVVLPFTLADCLAMVPAVDGRGTGDLLELVGESARPAGALERRGNGTRGTRPATTAGAGHHILRDRPRLEGIESAPAADRTGVRVAGIKSNTCSVAPQIEQAFEAESRGIATAPIDHTPTSTPGKPYTPSQIGITLIGMAETMVDPTVTTEQRTGVNAPRQRQAPGSEHMRVRGFKATDAEWDRIHRVAASEGCTVGTLLRRVMAEYADAQGTA